MRSCCARYSNVSNEGNSVAISDAFVFNPCVHAVVRLLLFVYGFMALCSAVGFFLPRNVRQAINSWWPPALLGGVVVTAPTWVGVFVFTLVSIWTLYEYERLAPADPPNSFIRTLVYCAAPLHYFLLGATASPFALGLAVWIFVVLPLAWVFSIGPRQILTGLPRLQWGMVLTIAALSHVPRLLLLPGGQGLALLLFTAVMSNDAAQYVFGRLFGRTALAPALSPKKTWEGLAGGVLTTAVVAALGGPLVTPFNALQSARIGVALSIVGLFGDLLMSAIKRDAGVKDTGAALPQHGGVLDRCDSLLFTAPLFFYGVRAWLT